MGESAMNICKVNNTSLSDLKYWPARHRYRVFVIHALVIATGLQLGVSSAAYAASSESTENTLQTIIVTSTRVSENVQTVPMSITPLTADTLEKAGAVDFL